LAQIDAEAIDAYVTARRKEFRQQPCRKHAEGERCPQCNQRIESATVNRDLGALRHMLRLTGRKWRWLEREPYFQILPKNPPRDLELTEAEAECLLDVCGPELADVIIAGLTTGMRQGEILKLTWSQVDLTRRVIEFPPTKRGRKRLMPINERRYYVLARRKAAGQGVTGRLVCDHVFSRIEFGAWSRWAVEAQFAEALAAAGITKRLAFHNLCRTFASRLKRNGMGETEIQRLLGHKTLQMTDRYINVEIEQMRAATDSLKASKNNATQLMRDAAQASNYI